MSLISAQQDKVGTVMHQYHYNYTVAITQYIIARISHCWDYAHGNFYSTRALILQGIMIRIP